MTTPAPTGTDLLPPFFTVGQRIGTEGSEYVLTFTSTGEQRSVFDGEDDYWTLADIIDRRFQNGDC